MLQNWSPTHRPRRPSRFTPRLEALEERSLLNAGGLDPTFGAGGTLTTDFANGQDDLRAMAIQSDGKIVVAGYATQAGNIDVALARYLPDGSLDPTFGTNGKVTNFSAGYESAQDIAIDPLTGKIVVAVWSNFGLTNQFLLRRYLPNGQIDNTFDNDGIQVVSFGPEDAIPHSVVVQPDGKIVAAGSYSTFNVGSDFAVARLLDNGDLDPSFSGDGKVLININAFDWAHALALQADGKIVVAGGTFIMGADNDFALARLNADGTLDGTFGTLGKVVTDISGFDDEVNALAMQGDGKIVAAGWTKANGDFALARYNLDGSLDTTFSGDGKVTTDFDTPEPFSTIDLANGVAIQADGKIVAAGASFPMGASSIAVARYHADGSLDAGFGSGGQTKVMLNGQSAHGTDMALQADGKIVVTGQVSNNFAVIRLESADPPPPVSPTPVSDVTTQVSVVKSKVRRTRRLGRFKQLVVITNTGNAAIQGPLHLVLDGLKKKVKLRAANGLTQKQGPLGSPSRTLTPGGDNVLSPGESVAVMLTFRSPTLKRIKYATRVLAGPGAI